MIKNMIFLTCILPIMCGCALKWQTKYGLIELSLTAAEVFQLYEIAKQRDIKANYIITDSGYKIYVK